MLIALTIFLLVEAMLLAWAVHRNKALEKSAKSWKANYFAIKSTLDRELNK